MPECHLNDRRRRSGHRIGGLVGWPTADAGGQPGCRDQSSTATPPLYGDEVSRVEAAPFEIAVHLYEAPIRNHLRVGEAVYDPFIGSGTCIVAAGSLARSCHAMEVDPKDVHVSIERRQALTGRQAERVDA